MTIALAFNCVDGFVLLADSLESDGVTKKLVDKIWAYQVRNEWGISIASAGEADLADSFTDSLDAILGAEAFDQDKLLLTLRTAIAQTRRTYPEAEFGMLVGIFGPQFFRKVYRVTDNSKHLGPIRRYEPLGIGSQLANFLCSQMFHEFSLVDEAIHLGVWILSRVCEHVQDCGGPISVIASKKDKNEWLYEHPEKVAMIQKELPADDLKKNLIDFWMAKNPSIKRLTDNPYATSSVGGFPKIHIKVVDFKNPLKLSTIQKSKTKKETDQK